MPIKPENKARYPKDWPEIRLAILGRADHRCEWPGCGIQNGDTNPRTGSRVVLTIAHLDHTPENCQHSNLMAMCQQHHLAYDHDHHQKNAYQTRRNGKAVDMFEPSGSSRAKHGEGSGNRRKIACFHHGVFMSDYKVPPKKLDPKTRLIVVTDPIEIASIEHAGLNSPIGGCYNGVWYATEHSLNQFRGKKVEFQV